MVGRFSARDNVAALLGLISDQYENAACSMQSNDTATFERPLAREEIAVFLGRTIETISPQMTLKRDGIIALPTLREILVIDLQDSGH